MTNNMDQNQLMAELITLYGALHEYLIKFSQSTTSYSDYTEFDWYDTDGNLNNMKIPSIGNIKSDINEIKDQLESLIHNNDDNISLRYKDGSIRSFEMKKISKILDTINQINETEFIVPSEFKAKNNWMFEDFLNPLLSTSINVSKFTKDNFVKKFSVRRILLNSPSTEGINFFDSNFKGNNNLDYEKSIVALQNSGIPYNVDDNEYELSSSINRYRGSFSVIKIENDTVNISQTQQSRIYYTLDKLFYRDIINNPKGNTYLVENDVLITSDDTEYKVRSIDKNNNRVILERVFGNSPIVLGVNSLKIKPQAYRIPELQINIGYNERQLIFVKPIANNLDLSTDSWSKGFGIFTNELNIRLSDGEVSSLESYYNNYVSDFGLILLNFAKEKQIPSTLGLKPISPVINASDLKVVGINNHIKDNKDTNDFKRKISTKESLKNQIDEINKSINDNKSKLNTSSTSNDQERLSVQKRISDLVKEKSSLQKQLTSILDEITFNIKSSINLKISPKYRIRGFVQIPESRVDEYGEQAIIQMVYSYRYKSKSGNATNVENLPFTDNSGELTSAYFSNWNEIRSKIRKKQYDPDRGIYVWSDENVQDSDAVNINQLDIPINKGEIVEIKIKSVSEAGFPINPLESEWSNIISVEFPSNLEDQEEDSLIAERLIVENAMVTFQDELNSRGLDNHLFDSIITGDKYFSHKLEGIASGFFTQEGKIINSYEFVKNILDKLNSLEKTIVQDVGNLNVSILSPDGISYNINRGSNLELFAGYYDELTERAGDIQTVLYTLQLSNTSASIIELVSRFGGGLGEFVTEYENETDDYSRNRKYDKVPINISNNPIAELDSFKQKSGFQSGQVKSQYLYNRYRNYALDKLLYNIYPNSNYNDRFGRVSNIGSPGSIHTTGYHILPNFGNMLTNTPTTNTGIWNGMNGTGGNNGKMTEFSIHIDHPLVPSFNDVDDLRPTNPDGNQSYLPISHACGFYVSVEDKEHNGVKYYQQCEFIKPLDVTDFNYPVKVGFDENDEYLIGRYTCGSYLYIKPNSYKDISIVGNEPTTAKVSLKYGIENSINIPIVFQFRCQDKREYIGGYRRDKNIDNITYKKTIGIDIYEKLRPIALNNFDDVFSFDFTVWCKYKKDFTDTGINISNTKGILPVNYSG